MGALASTRHAILAVVDAGLWAAWSAVCGYSGHRLPIRALSRERVLRVHRIERGGRVYERMLRIKAWKDALPEAGSLFQGGFSKRGVASHDRRYLERFALETRRAELVHWAILVLSPVFFLWNPYWLALAMLAYGVAANVPCILVQRYNRARLARLLARSTAACDATSSPRRSTNSRPS